MVSKRKKREHVVVCNANVGGVRVKVVGLEKRRKMEEVWAYLVFLESVRREESKIGGGFGGEKRLSALQCKPMGVVIRDVKK